MWAAIPEIVRNGETGLIVPAGDAVSLTQALRDLATNPALRMTLGERAMAHVTRHYDAPTNASLLLGLLKAEANAARAEGLQFRRRAKLPRCLCTDERRRRSCGEGVGRCGLSVLRKFPPEAGESEVSREHAACSMRTIRGRCWLGRTSSLSC